MHIAHVGRIADDHRLREIDFAHVEADVTFDVSQYAQVLHHDEGPSPRGEVIRIADRQGRVRRRSGIPDRHDQQPPLARRENLANSAGQQHCRGVGQHFLALPYGLR